MASNCEECIRLIGVINKESSKVEELKKKVSEYKKNAKEANEQKEESRKKIEELEEKIKQLEQEIEELKKEVARIDALEETIKRNEKKYNEDMCKLKESNAASIQVLKQEMEECRGTFEWNDEENRKLKEENKKMNSEGRNKKVIQNEPKLYLGQICFELQDNFYRFVMPERCCAQGYWYKIKELERDIEDESLFKEGERRKAQRRFEQLKKRIDWEELHEKFMGTIKQLKYQRLEKAHPCVNEKEVRDAAKPLDEQGQLRGRTAIDRVRQVIEIWLTSKRLLGGQ